MSHKTNKINLFKINKEYSINNINFDNGYICVYSDKKSKLFLQIDKESSPIWSDFISSLAPSYKLKNKSNSFVYLITYKYSLYALTGGYGHNAIQDYIEDDFGLNVALRLIDSSSLSSINQYSMKGQTRQILRSVINYNPLLDADNYNRVLRSVAGKGSFERKNFSIQGKSSILLRTGRGIKDLPVIIDEIECISCGDEKISFFRSYEYIQDEKVISKLERSLYREILRSYRKKSNSRIYNYGFS